MTTITIDPDVLNITITTVAMLAALITVYRLSVKLSETEAKLRERDECLTDIGDIAYHWDGYYNPETGTGSLKDLADLVKELYDLARTRKPIPLPEEESK